MTHTDLPDRIVDTLEKHRAGMTAVELAEKLTATERTVRTHLLDLSTAGRLSRVYEYVGEGKDRTGHYRYFAAATGKKKRAS